MSVAQMTQDLVPKDQRVISSSSHDITDIPACPRPTVVSQCICPLFSLPAAGDKTGCDFLAL